MRYCFDTFSRAAPMPCAAIYRGGKREEEVTRAGTRRRQSGRAPTDGAPPCSFSRPIRARAPRPSPLVDDAPYLDALGEWRASPCRLAHVVTVAGGCPERARGLPLPDADAGLSLERVAADSRSVGGRRARIPDERAYLLRPSVDDLDLVDVRDPRVYRGEFGRPGGRPPAARVAAGLRRAPALARVLFRRDLFPSRSNCTVLSLALSGSRGAPG